MALGNIDQQIVRIKINRPPLNALDPVILKNLTEAFQRTSFKKNRVVILKGIPYYFSVGMDIKYMQSVSDKERELILTEVLEGFLRSVANCPIPVVAEISGHCLGAGAALAALCDYRVMAQGAYKFGLPEITIGLELPSRIKQLFTRLTGEHMAQRLCVEGVLVNGDQARQAGLVDEVVEMEEIETASKKWCEHMLSLPWEPMISMRQKCREDIHVLFKEK